MLLARVLLPIPRRDLRRAPGLAMVMLPSPRNDRLGSRIVHLSGLQASLHVAARVLASCFAALAALHASDARLQPSGSLPQLRACYSALRRFPRRDFHPLDHHSVTSVSAGACSAGSFRRHDAPSPEAIIDAPQAPQALAVRGRAAVLAPWRDAQPAQGRARYSSLRQSGNIGTERSQGSTLPRVPLDPRFTAAARDPLGE
jgi:hypothetical protein